MASYIKTPDHLAIVFDDGTPLTVYTNHPNYAGIIEALNVKDWDQVRRLADATHNLKRVVKDLTLDNRVTIVAGVVFLDGEPMRGLLCNRMLTMATEGYEVTPLKRFLVNLQENPSYRAVNSLYEFLEKSELPITEDGHFIAYKRVASNFTDERTGTIDNSVGAKPRVPRNQVDEDPERTCSHGLHVCARSYLPAYGSSGGGQVIMVKVHPGDVVAIPRDYNNAKIRTCGYEVLRALELEGTSYSAMPTEHLEAPFVDTRPPSTETETETETERVLTEEAKDMFESVIGRVGGSTVEDIVWKAFRTGKPMIAKTTGDGETILGVWNSIQEAADWNNVCASSIGKVCRGERKTAGHVYWKYLYPKDVPVTTRPVQSHDALVHPDDDPCDPDYLDDPFMDSLDLDDNFGW